MANELEELERELTSAQPMREKPESMKAANKKQSSKRDYSYDDDGPLHQSHEKDKMRYLVLIAGAAAVIFIGSALWYVYNKGVLSGSETAAPILRAPGQAKLQPDTQDIVDVPEQGRRIYERIDGEPDPADLVEELLPLPEDPMRRTANVSNQDQVNGDVALVNNNSNSNDPPPPPSIVDNIVTTPIAPRIVPEPTLPAEGLNNPAVAPPTSNVATTNATAAVQAPSAVAPKVTADTTNANNTAASTGWRIQVAALGSREEAEAYWNNIVEKYPEQLRGLTLSLEQVEVKGKAYYRVRGGPLQNRAATENLCKTLKASNQACITVVPN